MIYLVSTVALFVAGILLGTARERQYNRRREESRRRHPSSGNYSFDKNYWVSYTTDKTWTEK